jgi:hypothetical protein
MHGATIKITFTTLLAFWYEQEIFAFYQFFRLATTKHFSFSADKTSWAIGFSFTTFNAECKSDWSYRT